uniref:Uncharacterized protein n=1 Tax=Glossina pallidipes TaxID=7398 RepID=A0A1A9ZSF3_GLOPL
MDITNTIPIATKGNNSLNLSNATDISASSIPQSAKATQLTGSYTVTKRGVQRHSANSYHIIVVPTFWKINGRNTEEGAANILTKIFATLFAINTAIVLVNDILLQTIMA